MGGLGCDGDSISITAAQQPSIMAGSPTPSFTTKMSRTSNTRIDFWFKPEGQELKLMDIRVQKGPKQDGDGYVMALPD